MGGAPSFALPSVRRCESPLWPERDPASHPLPFCTRRVRYRRSCALIPSFPYSLPIHPTAPLRLPPPLSSHDNGVTKTGRRTSAPRAAFARECPITRSVLD
eukprot:scaffold306029_cov27-Tisochrysis_lutea.AAC.2